MKRILTAALAAVMMLTVTACGGRSYHEPQKYVIIDESSSETQPTETERAIDTTQKPTETAAETTIKPTEAAVSDTAVQTTITASAAESDAEKTSAGDEKSQTVYITKTGKRYHYNPKCGSGKYFECTLGEALDRGLTPCKKCVKKR